jgi:hypothetical protein
LAEGETIMKAGLIAALLAGGCALIFDLWSARADTIVYNNGGPTNIGGLPVGPAVNSGDDFVIAGGATITGVGFYYQNPNDNGNLNGAITFALFSDSGGAPGIFLASGGGQNVQTTDSGLPACCGLGNAFLATFDLPFDFVAAPGVTYWLALTGAGGAQFFWLSSAHIPANARFGPGPPINPGIPPTDLAFFLTSDVAAVPIPPAMALFATGLAGLGWLARRRKKQAA